MPDTSTFTETEREIIILRAVWDMIYGLVNYDIFQKNHGTNEAQVQFSSEAHRTLFTILLSEFLSKPEAGGLFGLPIAQGSNATDHTFLSYLQRICDHPKLNSNSAYLRDPVELFIDWLEGECLVEKVWLTSIEVETNIKVKRITFLKICGDTAKHNFVRLGRNVQRIRKVLSDNGVTIDEGKGFLVLPEFYEWFHGNVSTYHGSTIAEFLNNIRWGIFAYLSPEFARSYEKLDSPLRYRFHYPSECLAPLPQAMYWDLMNEVRKEPFFPRFATAQILKKRF